MNKNKALFIIGGMGPEASGYLYNTLINLAIKKFGAKNNDDFPEIILHSIPVPDFISDTRSKKQALQMLKIRIQEANALNISCISIACNTAHILLEQLQQVSKTPFISMIEEFVKSIKADRVVKIGLLGTPLTLRFGLYQQALKKAGIEVVIPTGKQIQSSEKIIRNVIAGERSSFDQKKLKKIADVLSKRGATAIVLGCTELPLVFPTGYKLPVYNSVEILAEALLHKYYGQNTIGQR